MRTLELKAMAKVLAFDLDADKTESDAELSRLINLAETISSMLTIERFRRNQAALDAKKRTEELFGRAVGKETIVCG